MNPPTAGPRATPHCCPSAPGEGFYAPLRWDQVGDHGLGANVKERAGCANGNQGSRPGLQVARQAQGYVAEAARGQAGDHYPLAPQAVDYRAGK